MKPYIAKLKHLFTLFTSVRGTLFTYSFAYAFLLGMAPLLLLIVLFVSRYIREATVITNFLAEFIPEDLIVRFLDFLGGYSFSGVFSTVTLFVIAIYVASNSIYALILFDQERRDRHDNKLFLRLISIVNLVAILLVISVSLVFTGFVNGIFIHVNWLTQPLILFVVFLVFYRLLSIRDTQIRHVYKGSIAAALLISLAGTLFFTIINTFTHYENIYGPMASIMILLLSCYVVACIVYFGYCVNVVYSSKED